MTSQDVRNIIDKELGERMREVICIGEKGDDKFVLYVNHHRIAHWQWCKKILEKSLVGINYELHEVGDMYLL